MVLRSRDLTSRLSPDATERNPVSRLPRLILYTAVATGVLLWGSLQASQEGEIPADTEITTTDSGLKYSFLKKGDRSEPPPKMGDTVRVHYTGWLTDGTKFDSSRDRGEPIEFQLGRVVEGWNEGLQQMSPGDRVKLTIPPELGYGERGAPPTIPPGATLVFDVELFEVTKRVPDPPAFHEIDAAKAKTLESGLRYEVLEEGEGRTIEGPDAIELEYTFWDTSGKLIESSVVGGRNLTGTSEALPLPFLKEASTLMKTGTVAFFEVPPALGFGEDEAQNPHAGKTTVWRLKLVKILEVPEFVMPPAEELTTTDSGLKYKVLSEGSGESPKMYENVTCQYAGWLTNGTLFDSSYLRGQPATFMLGQVIPGWNEGLQLMKPGGTTIFVIPPDLGYGKPGSGAKIPPDSTLVFKIELISVQKPGR